MFLLGHFFLQSSLHRGYFYTLFFLLFYKPKDRICALFTFMLHNTLYSKAKYTQLKEMLCEYLLMLMLGGGRSY